MSSVSSMTFGPSYCRKWDWNFKFYKHQWESRCFFVRFFSNQEAKLFIIVRQPLTPLPEEKPVLNHFQCHTVFVCLFVFLSRSVSETNHSDDRLFSWGLPKGKKKKESIEVWVRDDSSVTAVTWPTSSEEKVWALILQAYRNEHLLSLSHSSCC